MPRTNSRKRNNYRNDNTTRVPISSNLSPNAPEFIPIANDEPTANQREHSAILAMAFSGSSSAPNSSGNEELGNPNNSEVTHTISTISDSSSNKGQRDLLINLLNNCHVDCVICYERAKNVEPIWNCRNCFQIMHLKCIMVWFIKSHSHAVWRCPACQNEVIGKPNYVCFCGSLPNPFHNNVDTPHSCGQVCGLQKKNSNVDYNDCHHKCTLLCHPGPCPQCVVQVLRKCGCGKTNVYVQCGQSAPIFCQNICSKELNCKNHVCEKRCHAENCEPCKKNCPQVIELMETNASERSPLQLALDLANGEFLRTPIPESTLVSEEELRMLGLNPEELLQRRTNEGTFYDALVDDYYYNDDDDNEDDDDEDDNDYEDLDDTDDEPSDPSSRFYGVWSDIHEPRIRFPFPGLVIPISRFNSQITENLANNSNSNDEHSEESSTSSSNSSTDSNEIRSNMVRYESVNDNLLFLESSSEEENDNDSDNSSMESEPSDHSYDISDLNSGDDDYIHVDSRSSSSSSCSRTSSVDSSNSSQSSISYLDDDYSSTSSESSSSSCY